MSERYTTAEVFDPTEELDLTGEGLQRQRATFEIVEANVNPTKAGDGTVAAVEFQSVEPVDGIESFTVSDYFVLAHPKLSVAKGGRGKLKRLFRAALGTTTGAIASLPGRLVSAEVWEDDEGFRRIGRYQPISTAEDGTAMGEAAELEAVSL